MINEIVIFMQSTISFLIVVLGYLAFGIWAIIWISRKKKVGEKISLRAKIIIAVIFFSSSSVLISMIEPSPPATPSEFVTYYVKPDVANVRECPSTSCKTLSTFPQNTELTFPGDLFDKYPDWAEVTFPDGKLGYVSKTVLSEDAVSAGLPPPARGSSSVGGIAIGPWVNIQTTVGQSYEFHFCEPPAAISGATCGGLADTATNPTGGRPPYSFVKKSGFLPPGITLELNGTLSGTPTQAGTYNFRLCAKDLYGGEGCQNLAVVVNKSEASATTIPTPITENAGFVKIESATCQALGYSVPDNPNSWIVYLITVTGTGGGSSLGFFCDHRYGGGPCHNQSLTCDSWTVKHVGSCVRETGQSETTEWTYQARGFINLEMGFNFGVQIGYEDEIRRNISCN